MASKELENMADITSNWRNANQSHNEVLLHTHEDI